MMNEKLIAIVIGLIFTSYADAYVANTDKIKLGWSWDELARNTEPAPDYLDDRGRDEHFNFRGKDLDLLGENDTKYHSQGLVIDNEVVHLRQDNFVHHTTSVPEPGNVVLFVLGLLGLGLSRHKLRHD